LILALLSLFRQGAPTPATLPLFPTGLGVWCALMEKEVENDFRSIHANNLCDCYSVLFDVLVF